MRIYLLAMLFSLLNAFSSEDPSFVSIYAVDGRDNKVLREQNSGKSLIPASCMKVVTTGAALHLLDPEMRFETRLEYEGTIDPDGTLHGNLIILGGGDPCLGSGKWKEQLGIWGMAVSQLGIKKIAGKVIGDASKWEKAMAVPSWTWEDLGNYYGAGASALSFHENSYSLTFKPGAKEGDPTEILSLDPPLPDLLLINEVTTGPAHSGDRACIYGAEFLPMQSVRGTIPAEVPSFTIRGAIPDPASTVAALLTQELKELGISVERCFFARTLPTLIHTTHSPPLKEIVYWTNQKSINLYAEHLLKKMGEGSTDAGVKAVTAFWESQGIDLAGFHMADGSGLSRKNCVTAKQMVSILLKMKESKVFPLFLRSLPDQTRCKAKSGYMSQVRGLVGYFDDEVAFAILTNHNLLPCPIEGIVVMQEGYSTSER